MMKADFRAVSPQYFVRVPRTLSASLWLAVCCTVPACGALATAQQFLGDPGACVQGDRQSSLGDWEGAHLRYRQCLAQSPNATGLQERTASARRQAVAFAVRRGRACQAAEDWECAVNQYLRGYQLDDDPKIAEFLAGSRRALARQIVRSGVMAARSGEFERAYATLDQALAQSWDASIVQEVATARREIEELIRSSAMTLAARSGQNIAEKQVEALLKFDVGLHPVLTQLREVEAMDEARRKLSQAIAAGREGQYGEAFGVIEQVAGDPSVPALAPAILNARAVVVKTVLADAQRIDNGGEHDAALALLAKLAVRDDGIAVAYHRALLAGKLESCLRLADAGQWRLAYTEVHRMMRTVTGAAERVQVDDTMSELGVLLRGRLLQLRREGNKQAVRELLSDLGSLAPPPRVPALRRPRASRIASMP